MVYGTNSSGNPVICGERVEKDYAIPAEIRTVVTNAAALAEIRYHNADNPENDCHKDRSLTLRQVRSNRIKA